MQSHELLREVFASANVKQLAAEIGLSQSLIYKWAEPAEVNGSGTANPLDRVVGLIGSTKDPRIIQWLCERADGFYIKNPKGNWPNSQSLIPATNKIVEEFADLLGVIAIAATDNTISPEEARTIRRRWEDLKSATEGFVRCSEEGNFSPLNQLHKQKK